MNLFFSDPWHDLEQADIFFLFQPNDDHYGNDLIDAPVEIEVDETYNVDAPMLGK